MRGMFGLVSLLVCVAIVLYLFTRNASTVLPAGQQAHDQAQQISGRGKDGGSVMDSFKMEPEQQGSRLNALRVTEVTPGGAADDYYGLKKGDRITALTTQAGLQKVGEASNDDSVMAKIKVQEAFQGSNPIVVMRDGKQLTLPAPAPSAAPAAAGGGAPAQTPPAATPTQAPAQPAAPRNVYDQINNIKNSVPGQ